MNSRTTLLNNGRCKDSRTTHHNSDRIKGHKAKLLKTEKARISQARMTGVKRTE